MRNIPQAVLTGAALIAVLLIGLYTHPFAFLAVLTVFMGLAFYELNGAFALAKIKLPVPALVVCGILMAVAAYYGGLSSLIIAFALSLCAVIVYASLAGTPKDRRKMMVAGVFVLTYISFLSSFFVLLLGESHGANKVLWVILIITASDSGGLILGSSLGKHQMCPTISPKKTWEGFAGSLLFALIMSFLVMFFLFPSAFYTGNVWVAPALAVVCTFTGTFGDLAESLVKRDIGVKDMSNLLAGHGGVLDRLDSILLTAPAAYALLNLAM